MTYHDLVAKVKSVFEKADAHGITEHVAVQINIEGEAEGIFYLEVADGSVKVEPYDYHDRDLLITVSASVLTEIAEGKITGVEAAESGRLHAEGNVEKSRQLRVLDVQKAEPVIESAEKAEEKSVVESVENADEPAAIESAEEAQEETPAADNAETVDEPPKADQTPKAQTGRQMSRKQRKKWKKKKTC